MGQAPEESGQIKVGPGLALFLAVGLFLQGCGPALLDHSPPSIPAPPPTWSFSADKVSSDRQTPWWRSFNDPALDQTISAALAGNFSVKEAAARLERIAAQAGIEDVRGRPSLSLEGSGDSRKTADGGHDASYGLNLHLSWQIDLWGRLSATARAARLNAAASADDLAATKLLVSGRAADLYFRLLAERQQAEMLRGQIETGEKMLKLVQLRFANGVAPVVDVYQQRQQILALKAALSRARGNAALIANDLRVLCGLPPDGRLPKGARPFPVLPPIPAIGLPGDLLRRRPDLAAAEKSLAAADQRVAAAVAARLPELRLGADSGFSGNRMSASSLFLSIFADAVAPVIDWGEKKNALRAARAELVGESAAYRGLFVKAIGEVENAVAKNRMQEEYLALIEEQLRVARMMLRESRNRYAQGLTDYIPVLTALNAVQAVERDLIAGRGELLRGRVELCMATGGGLGHEADRREVGK